MRCPDLAKFTGAHEAHRLAKHKAGAIYVAGCQDCRKYWAEGSISVNVSVGHNDPGRRQDIRISFGGDL
jgi:hypothetical protein